MHLQSDGSVVFGDPSGAWFTFIKQSNGSFITPAAIHAIVCAAGSPAPCPGLLPSGVSYELIYNQSQTKFEFNSGGYPVAVLDRYGNQQTITYNGSEINQVTDTQGRRFTYSYQTFPDANNAISAIQDAAGSRSISFSYMTTNGDQLSAYTDANHNQTSYGYDASGNLSSLTTPKGNQIAGWSLRGPRSALS